MSSAWGAGRERTGEGLRSAQEEAEGEGRPLSPSLPLKPPLSQSHQTDCLCLADNRHIDINSPAPTCCSRAALGVVVPTSPE